MFDGVRVAVGVVVMVGVSVFVGVDVAVGEGPTVGVKVTVGVEVRVGVAEGSSDGVVVDVGPTTTRFLKTSGRNRVPGVLVAGVPVTVADAVASAVPVGVAVAVACVVVVFVGVTVAVGLGVDVSVAPEPETVICPFDSVLAISPKPLSKRIVLGSSNVSGDTPAPTARNVIVATAPSPLNGGDEKPAAPYAMLPDVLFAWLA